MDGRGQRAHASTDLYVRSGDTSGLIVIIAHASVNTRDGRAPINIRRRRRRRGAPGLHRPQPVLLTRHCHRRRF